MELKPSRDKHGTRKKQRLDGVGNKLADEDHKNPFGQIARGLNPSTSQKRKRWAADTLGATPQRDGPFEMAAEDVAVMKPPKTRKKRNADLTLSGLGPVKR